MSAVKLPCYCATLRQATRLVTSLYDDRLRKLGIRATQFNVLQALEVLSKARSADMEDILAMDQTTLSRSLSLLSRRGLIEVVDRPSGREKRWGLSSAGSTLLQEAKPLWEQAQAEVKLTIGSKRALALHDDIFKLVAALG
jgi:DNA-binding MarR family transcriptional regulator